jgi:hypothetical protein
MPQAPRRQLPSLLGLGALLLLLLGAPPHLGAAELDDATWRDARKQAVKLMKTPGKRYTKQSVIRTLGQDNSERAAALLVQWTLKSQKLQVGPVRKELAEATEKFEKVKRIMRKAYEKLPPTRPEDRKAWNIVKKAYDEALENHLTENGVRYTIGEAFRAVSDPEAITYLMGDGLAAVQKAKGLGAVQVDIGHALARQPKARVLAVMQALAVDRKRVKLRMLALQWFGQHKHAEGYDPLVHALVAKEVAVRRLAIYGLQQLGEKRAVKSIIDSMAKSDGLLRAEIDDVLHWFTGKSFEGSPTVWKRWWDDAGATWLTAEDTERHERKTEPREGGTQVRFYGIPTASHHVVFVLDRSGSMKKPAGAKSIEEKGRKPKPPVTGGSKDERKKKGDGPVAGDTRMEVAKNQLARSIQELDKRVNFNVVFYSDKIQAWKEPPELLRSSMSNKKAATAWFQKLEPQGPTLMFPALMRALEYADTVGADKKKSRQGADTIFLLSDGSPTTKDGGLMAAEDLEAAVEAFLVANKLHRCIVHTIGIGPGHNSTILRRLADATGGQYKSVGTR